ncbi:MAG: hypothetical protein ACOX1T_02805 [Saccharofermentanales bacterium]
MSDSKLHHVRQQVIRQQPLPEELSVRLDETRLQELLQLIETTATGDGFDLLVARLPRRQLNDLFGLLLVIEAPLSALTATEQAQQRIQQIIERRATLSLAQTGWAFYQQHFYHVELAEAMARLNTALTAKGETPPFLALCGRFGCEESLPRQTAQFLLDEQQKPLSGVNGPWSLSSKLAELSVYAASRFGTLLLLEFFQLCPPELTAAETELFSQCLELAETAEKARLITAIYNEFRGDQKFLPLNQVILQQFGMPPAADQAKPKADPAAASADALQVWAIVPEQVRLNFRQWAMINLIGRQTVGQERKRALYQPLLMQLVNCCLLAPAVLLLEFPGFYLLDHQDFSHQVMYYDRPTLELALENKQDPAELAAPDGKVITARELVLAKNRGNRVLLRLEEVNLLFARDFLNSVLNPDSSDTFI